MRGERFLLAIGAEHAPITAMAARRRRAAPPEPERGRLVDCPGECLHNGRVKVHFELGDEYVDFETCAACMTRELALRAPSLKGHDAVKVSVELSTGHWLIHAQWEPTVWLEGKTLGGLLMALGMRKPPEPKPEPEPEEGFFSRTARRAAPP